MDLNNDTFMQALGVSATVGVLLAIGANIPLINITCCCLSPFIFGAAGIPYAYLEAAAKRPIERQQWAIAGGLTGGAAGFVWSVTNSLIAALVTAVSGVSITDRVLEFYEIVGFELPAEVSSQMAANGSTYAALGAGINMIVAFALAGVLGAIGAAIFTARLRRMTSA